jgi:hypothetical protein
MDNKQELNQVINGISQRKRVKVYKSKKGYDRTKDRKDKRLYEVDLEEEKNNGVVEESPSVFQSSKSSI